MPRMEDWCRKILLTFGTEMGHLPKVCYSVPQKAPKHPRDTYDHLLNEEDSDNAHYDSFVPQRNLHFLQLEAGTSPVGGNTFQDGHKWHETGSPSDTTWYTDGSLLKERAGTGVVNGKLRIKARTPGLQTIYRAEMYGVWIVATLAQPGDTVVLDSRAVTKAVIYPPHLQSSDYDLHQASYTLFSAKQLTIRLARGHKDPKKAHNLQDYQD